jgi:hypothetical protein
MNPWFAAQHRRFTGADTRWMVNEVPEPMPGDGAPPAAHQHRATARRSRLPPPPRDTRPHACMSQVRPLRAGWLDRQPGLIARPEGATGGSTVAARGRCVQIVFVPWDPSALQILWSRKGSTPLRAVRGAAAGTERRGRLRLMPGGGVATVTIEFCVSFFERSNYSGVRKTVYSKSRSPRRTADRTKTSEGVQLGRVV